jgi:hypothetical protein
MLLVTPLADGPVIVGRPADGSGAWRPTGSTVATMDGRRASLDAVRRVVGWLGGLLPEPPSDASPPPDLDGRRPTGIDPETMRRLDRTRKNGHGGNR